MSRKDQYNTKQKENILTTIESLNKDFCVKELYALLQQKVGLTTIYRFIDKLQEEGKLRKYIAKDNKTYYQYLEECEKENHFYLKCDACRKKIHIDCDCITDLFLHINEHHKFLPNKKNIVITGLCKNCRKKEGKYLC